jgi:hypothetical protein
MRSKSALNPGILQPSRQFLWAPAHKLADMAQRYWLVLMAVNPNIHDLAADVW